MSYKAPIHAEAAPAPASETAPLLGPMASALSTAPSSSASDISGADVENGRNDDAPKGDAPKLKVNMKALLPALAIGVGCQIYQNVRINVADKYTDLLGRPR